ncbi:MAG: TetR family transcriptional regulator [Pyrinomonadaceae bacterium]
MSKKVTKTQKGEQTKALILNAALETFHEHGYEKTTMRTIAKKAGLSLGSAYYYFRSKEHLIQAFYQRTHEQHLAALEAEPKSTSLKAGLLTVMRLKISTLAPYHEFAGVLFKTAAHPQSPLNPFGPDSDPVRTRSIAVFRDLVEDSNVRIPKDLREELPSLLWLYHMGIILFWIHDSSRKQARTYRMIDQTVDLLDRLISLASNPLMRPVRKRALGLVKEFREAAAESYD